MKNFNAFWYLLSLPLNCSPILVCLVQTAVKVQMTPYSFRCKDCDEELYLDYNVTSPSGKRIPLEMDSQSPHNCSMREQFVYESPPFLCEACGQSLYVTDRALSKYGKRIPLNLANDQPHYCPNRKHSFPCKHCKKEIYLDHAILSKNGKRIPLDATNGMPHDCPQKAITTTRNL